MSINVSALVATGLGAAIANFFLARHFAWKEGRSEIEMVRLKSGRYRDVARVKELRVLKWMAAFVLVNAALFGFFVWASQQTTAPPQPPAAQANPEPGAG